MQTSTSEEVSNAHNELLGALSTLHLSGKYSDLTITCNYKQWAVHRAIVCSRSGFFDGACAHSFREASTGVIDLSEDDQDAVEQMVHFFYHLDYLNNDPNQRPSAVFRHRAISDARKKPPKKLDLSQVEDPLLAQMGFYVPQAPLSPPMSVSSDQAAEFPGKRPRTPKRNSVGTPPPETEVELNLGEEAIESGEGYDQEMTESESYLLLHTRVYALAEKYDVPSLKELARRKFEVAMACFYDSDEFPDAIEEVYCSTVDSDRGLRDIVLHAFRTHPQLASTQDVFSVIKNTPTLALELYKLERGIPV